MRTYLRCFMVVSSVALCIAGWQVVHAQDELPVIITPASDSHSQAMVCMITGDGGWKSTDKQLSRQFADKGIPVVALNALKYFWKPKTPEQTTAAVVSLLDKYMQEWHKTQFILVGFSFGADVMPFVVNRLPPALSDKNELIVLLSPGPTTDFTIHISQMMSSRKQWRYNVVEELDKIKNKRLLCFFGKEEETEFPINSLPASSVIYLKGGHHYEDNKADIAALILQAR